MTDKAEQSFVGHIREHGWTRTGVFRDDDGPGFSFTTGFWVSARQPELIMFGLEDDIAHDVFRDVYRDAKAGRVLPLGTRTRDVFSNLAAFVFPVAKRRYSQYLGWSCWFYGGNDFPCIQIVWPDRAGVFPWETGFDPELADSQMDLTENGWLASIVH